MWIPGLLRHGPVGGPDVMTKVADLLGMAIANTEPKVAVVRCNGTCEKRPRIVAYDGLRSCAAMNSCGAGETGCGFGCLGCGDCVAACQFGAIVMNEETGLPEVDEEKCTSCGACVKACPITVESNVAYIDPEKCRLCRKCEAACPTGAIVACNFPPRKEKPAEAKPAVRSEETVAIKTAKSDNENTVKEESK